MNFEAMKKRVTSSTEVKGKPVNKFDANTVSKGVSKIKAVKASPASNAKAKVSKVVKPVKK